MASGQRSRNSRASGSSPTSVIAPTALLAGLIVILIPFPSIQAAGPADKISPHHFQQPCQQCHEVSKGSDNTRAKQFIQDDPTPKVGEIIGDINMACGQANCHSTKLDLSHPVGVKPEGEIPADLPLDRLSQITCITCHDELGRFSQTSDNPFWLRRSPGLEFCASCHHSAPGDAKTRSHWQFTTRAHLIADKKSSLASQLNEANHVNVDSESRNCLSCHENKSNSVVSEQENWGHFTQKATTPSNHPIGMIYQDTARRRGSSLKDPMLINPGIRFVGGRVGCGSCHNLYQNTPNHLALADHNNSLCRNCHDR